jgi:hypothetical protein
MAQPEQEEETPIPAPSKTRPLQRGGPIRRLRRYAYYKWPSLLSDPDEEERLAYWWDKDGEENAKTAPPADEFVDLHCIWAIEFYTPAHVEGILNGFAKLGWDKDDETLFRRNPAQWVRQSRETSQGGAWFNLNLIVRPGDKRFFGQKRMAPLPQNADHAVGEIFSLTSSLTCVAIGFVLDDEASRQFDAALRQERKTTSKPTGRGYTILRPRNQKETAIQAVRAEMRAAAGKWFCENLPGLFASRILGGEYPTCEFVTLRTGQPFPKREQNSAMPDEYLHILGMAHDADAWELDGFPDFKFAWPLFPTREGRFHGVLAVNENSFDAEALKIYGGQTRSAYQHYVDSHVSGLLSRWSLLALLSAFERHLNTVRDSATFRPSRSHNTLRLLETLGNLLSKSADIAAVSSELASFTNRKSSFLYEVETFKPSCPEYYKGKDTTLGDVLREHIGERAQSLEKTDSAVRDLLSQYGAILGARENIKLQQTVGRLTWFMVLMTIAILVLTAVLTYSALS